MKNGNDYKEDYGDESTVNAADTSSGDTWICKAFTPLGSKVGEASVGIDTATAGTVVIDPAKPYTTDNLKGYVSGINAPFDFYWMKNGNDYKEDYGTESIITASETKKHDIWTLKAYTPLYNSKAGEASVEISNSVPVITSVNAPSEITEGNELTASFSASDADEDTLTYRIYRNDVLIASSNSNTWTTNAGDAGIYVYTFSVNDGEAETISTATVTVNADGSGGNGGGEGGGEAGKVLKLLKKLEISPIYNYLKIRNEGTKIKDLKVTITYTGINAYEKFSFDLGKNEVVFKTLSTELEENKTYLAKVEVDAKGVDDSGYLLIKN
jgi:hypothetical protein